MRQIIDHSLSLDLNPRQIYIILRKDNEQYRDTFEALSRECIDDDIRYCVIDTTSFDEQIEKRSYLYTEFQGEDNPWDFIVRDYPVSKDDFSFTCEHITGKDAASVRQQLLNLKEWQDDGIWSTITRAYRMAMKHPSSAMAKRETFLNLQKTIQRSKGLSDKDSLDKVMELEKHFEPRKADKADQERAVRDFVGDQTSLMDAYMGVSTPRDLSDELMLTFMQTGGYTSRPYVKLVKTETAAKPVHKRFSLEIRTSTGQVFRPEFKTEAAFAWYILMMRNPGIHIRKEDFKPEAGSEYGKYYCQVFAAINATLKENLFSHTGEALQSAEQDCMSFLTKMQKDDKFWQNCNAHCDLAITECMKEQGAPFLLRPVKGKKPERWLDTSEDYVSLDEPTFREAFKKNLQHIVSRNLFKVFDQRHSSEDFSQLKVSQDQHNNPIFTAIKQSKRTEKMEKKTIICCGQYNFDAIWKRIFDANGKKLRDELHTEEIGGTAGNVACMTAYLGWHSYPLLQVGTYPQDVQTRRDFERYGCDTRFVLTNENANVTLYETFHHMDEQGHNLRHTKETVAAWEKKGKDAKVGTPIRTFSKTHAPFSGFPRVRTLSVREEAPAFVERLDFVPDVFFFDDPAAGWRYLAEALRQKGTLVYFEAELNGKNLKELLPCMKLADIVKFSDEHDEDYSFVDEMNDKLIIQTLGSKGIRFNLRGQGWQTLSPVVNEHVVDTEGCGDWTSSTFLTGLMKRDCLKMEKITEEVVIESLKEAQQMASLNVSYIGSKGLIYDDKEFGLAKSDYVDPYRPLMALKPLPYKHIKKLEDIPAKDLREYDDAESFVYNSGHERIHGEDWYFGKQAKDLTTKGIELGGSVHTDQKTACSVMSNFYPCVLEFDGKTFNSAEQMYHYYRYQEYPLVQDVIMRQKKGSDVKSACQDFKRYDTNHNDVRWKYMTLCIELKYLQCKAFRDKLTATDGLYLVESTPGYDVHGSTIPGSHETLGGTFRGHDVSTKYIGMNGCGRCMMAVRDKFRGWTEAQLKAYTPSADLEEWWQASPTYLEQLDGMGL